MLFFLRGVSFYTEGGCPETVREPKVYSLKKKSSRIKFFT